MNIEIIDKANALLETLCRSNSLSLSYTELKKVCMRIISVHKLHSSSASDKASSAIGLKEVSGVYITDQKELQSVNTQVTALRKLINKNLTTLMKERTLK